MNQPSFASPLPRTPPPSPDAPNASFSEVPEGRPMATADRARRISDENRLSVDIPLRSVDSALALLRQTQRN